MARSLLGPALLISALTTACGNSHTPQAAPSPSATATTSPEELCTRIIAHWSREILDSNTYGDYQSMGLSNGQYEILRRVVDDARTEKRRHGGDAAETTIDREAREGCADRYRSGTPSEGAWR